MQLLNTTLLTMLLVPLTYVYLVRPLIRKLMLKAMNEGFEFGSREGFRAGLIAQIHKLEGEKAEEFFQSTFEGVFDEGVKAAFQSGSLGEDQIICNCSRCTIERAQQEVKDVLHS